MADDQTHDDEGASIDEAHLLLIVVGAHLRAEVADRPLAYRLRKRIHEWLDDHDDDLLLTIVPVVCSDIWYVNQQELHCRPTVSVGGPEVNALTAYLANELSPVLVRDDQIAVQLDPEFVDLRACVWGADHRQTADAVQLLADKYLDGYLRAVATQVEPREE